jgi:glycosyltransferase involved in cell wall biosynthesis
MINDELGEYGGAAVYMYNVKYHLESMGHIVKIMGSDALIESVFDDNTFIFKSFKKHPVLRYLTYFFNPSAIILLRKVLKNFQPDVVHINNFLNYASPSILIPLKRVPTVVTAHEYKLICPRGNLEYHTGYYFNSKCKSCVGWLRFWPEKLKYAFLRKFIKNIDYFIAPSEFMRDLLTKSGYNPVSTIYNGITPLPYSRINNFRCILYVGNLLKIKGVDNFLKSAAILLKKFPDMRFNIAGGGPEKEKLSNLADSLGIKSSVTFLGHVQNSAIKELYHNNTVVVCPSITPENLPTVIIEAMFTGRVVVASDIGGIPELINNNETGYLVKTNDYKQIADVVENLITNTDRLQDISVKARIFASDTFDMQKHLERLVSVYKIALDSKNNVISEKPIN